MCSGWWLGKGGGGGGRGEKGKGLDSIGNSPTSVRVIQEAGSTNCWVVLSYLKLHLLKLGEHIAWVASGWILTVFLLK